MGKFKEYLLNESIIHTDTKFIDELNLVKNKVLEKNLGTYEICEIFNDKLRKYGLVFRQEGFSVSDNSEYAKSWIRGAGTNERGIVTIFVEDEFYKVFDYEGEWNNFIKVLKRIVSHELVHKGQISRIKAKNKEQSGEILRKLGDDERLTITSGEARKYLSRKMELMSFAKEAIEEFRDIGYTDKQILNRIRKPLDKNIYPSKEESHIFYRYTDYFDINEKPFKDFLKYCYHYLNKKEDIKKNINTENLFFNYIKNKRFKNPETDNQVLFYSLPEKEQNKIREIFRNFYKNNRLKKTNKWDL